METALPSLFAPSIAYLAYIAGGAVSCIWTGERYEKQTLRNRADFLDPSGIISFSIPIQRYPHPTPPISEIHISEHGQWRPKLKHALVSAYNSAPFWEHYESAILRAISYRDTDLLMDFNHFWLDLLCSAWGLPCPTPSSTLPTDALFRSELGACDYITTQQSLPRYWQVFEQKLGFVPGLSALDLLLTQGPEGRIYLLNLYESLR